MTQKIGNTYNFKVVLLGEGLLQNSLLFTVTKSNINESFKRCGGKDLSSFTLRRGYIQSKSHHDLTGN